MEKHDLIHEFTEHKEKIHDLKIQDSHFKKLFDNYHEINNEIHRIESGAEITADEVLNKLRADRVHLKDELYTYLN
jgi:uncharacterized protein YdcH (DUF465 family)